MESSGNASLTSTNTDVTATTTVTTTAPTVGIDSSALFNISADGASAGGTEVLLPTQALTLSQTSGSMNNTKVSIAKASDGGMYVGGGYTTSPPIILNMDGSASSVTLPTVSKATYLVRHSAAGVAQWGAIISIGAYNYYSTAVKEDVDGSVVMSVQLNSGGDNSLSVTIIDSNGTSTVASSMATGLGGNIGILTVKFDAAGNYQSDFRISNTASGYGHDMALGPTAGTIYLATVIKTTDAVSIIDSNGQTSTVQTAHANYTSTTYLTYVAKFLNGVCQWIVTPGTSCYYRTDIEVDSSGNVYVAGSYYDSSSFTMSGSRIYNGDGQVSSVTLPATGAAATAENSSAAAVVKFSAGGVAQWVVRIDTDNNDEKATSVKVSPNGDVYVFGFFDYLGNSNTITNIYNADGSVTVTFPVATKYGAVWVIKYNQSGVAQWATSCDGAYSWYGDYQPTLDPTGNVLLLLQYLNSGAPVFKYANGGSLISTLPSNMVTDQNIFAVLSGSTGECLQTQVVTTADPKLIGIDVMYVGSNMYALFNSPQQLSTTFDVNGASVSFAGTNWFVIKFSGTLLPSPSTGGIDLSATNALILSGTSVQATASSNMTFQSGSNMLAFTPTTALIQSVDNAMQISACNDMVIDTQVFTLTTTNNLTVASACNLTLVAPGGALLVTPSNVALTSDSNLDVLSTADMTIYSGNDLYLTAECNLVITASNLSLPLANFNMDSSGNLNMTAAGTMTLEGGGGSSALVLEPNWAAGTTGYKLIPGLANCAATSSGALYAGILEGNPVTVYNADGSLSSVAVQSFASGVYVVKYDTAGAAQWAASVNLGNWDVKSVEVQTNSAGEVYLLLQIPSMLESFTSSTATLYDSNGSSVTTFTSTHVGTLMVKYSSTGVPIAYSIYHRIYSATLYIDSVGGEYVQGDFNSFGSNLFDIVTSSGTQSVGGYNDGYRLVIKSLNGVYQWTCGILASTTNTKTNSLYVDNVSNVYVTAPFYSGNISVTDTTGPFVNNSKGYPFVALIKFNAQGVLQWYSHQRFTTATFQNFLNTPVVTGDLVGNVYMSGGYNTAEVDKSSILYNSDGSISPYSLVPDVDTTQYGGASYVIKYTSTGFVQWVSSIMGTYWTSSRCTTRAVVNGDGDIIVGSDYAIMPTFCNADLSVQPITLPITQAPNLGSLVAVLGADGIWKTAISSIDSSTGGFITGEVVDGLQDLAVSGSDIYAYINLKVFGTPTSTISFSDGTTVTAAPDRGVLIKLTTTAAGGALYLRSGSNLVAVTPSSISLEVTEAINATACNNLFTVAAASTLFTAADTLYLSASNGISFHSDSNMSLSAFSADNSLLSLTGDSQVLFWSGTNKFLIEPTFAQFGDSNSFFTLTSAGIVEQSVSTQVIAASNYGLTSSDIAVNSSATLTLTSESNFTASASNVSVATPTGQQLIELDDDTGIIVDSAKKILVAANDIVGAQGGMLIDGATHEVFMASQTETNAVMSSIKCIDSNIIAFATSNQQYFIGSAASGTPILLLTASGTSTAGTQHDIFAANSNVAAITMYRDVDESVMHVLGRVDLDGAINTINKSNLDIADKVVVFASPDSSNVDLTDGMVNERSGIYIYGKPATPAFSNDPQPGDVHDVTQRYYEKSMIWCMGAQGMDKLGSATGIDYSTSILNESYWQLRGGNLQLTTAQSDGSNVRDTSYGFRINSRGELELYKHHWENGQYKSRKLKMWGHMVGSQFPAR
jgi:uncharacterized protein (DUF2345 family)